MQEAKGHAVSDDDVNIPVFDLAPFVQTPLWEDPEGQAICEQLANCFRNTGCIIVRDPRVGTADSESFLDLMEQYFGQTHEAKMNDARPDLFYQVQPFTAPPVMRCCKLALLTTLHCSTRKAVLTCVETSRG